MTDYSRVADALEAAARALRDLSAGGAGAVPSSPAPAPAAQPGSLCSIHGAQWKGTVGDLWHPTDELNQQTGKHVICRHPANVRRGR